MPFLHLGRVRNILIPDIGTNVPFTIRNFPYLDPYGRETVTFAREFSVRQRPSRFDATMILHAGQVVDYLGTHQHLAVDLQLRAGADGSLLVTTHAQRFYAGPIGFMFPLLFSGTAVLRESWDPVINAFRVDLTVSNRVFGFLFGYTGTFTCEYVPATDAPAELNPCGTSAAPELVATLPGARPAGKHEPAQPLCSTRERPSHDAHCTQSSQMINVLAQHPWLAPGALVILLVLGPPLGARLVHLPGLAWMMAALSTLPVLAVTLLPVQRELYARCTLQWSLPTPARVESLANVLLFVAPALLMGVASRRPVVTVAVGSGFSMLIEVVQAILPVLGRSCDTSDWLNNTIGAAVGGGLAGAALVLARRRARRGRSRAHP